MVHDKVMVGRDRVEAGQGGGGDVIEVRKDPRHEGRGRVQRLQWDDADAMLASGQRRPYAPVH